MFDQVYMLYSEGDVCQYNKSRTYSSRIRLECDPDMDQLAITFSEPDEFADDPCTWEFVARTSVACPQELKTLHLHEDCSYTDPRTGLSADLRPLSRDFGEFL